MKKDSINYSSRDFTNIRQDLINYIQYFFPEQWQDFNIASPGMSLLELNAYVADLMFNTMDKKYNEMFIDGVTSKKGAYDLAKTFGFKVPGTRPAMSIADIIIDIPVTSNGPDISYLPIYRSGMKVRGGGQTFETINDIDFSSDFNNDGIANRTIEPIFNTNQNIIKYRVRKREKIEAGQTKIYSINTGTASTDPFYEVILPDDNVLEILSIIVYQGQTITINPTFSDFSDDNKRFYEVDDLPEDKIFIEDDSKTVNGVKYGYWKEITKRFTKEFLNTGKCKLTFGGGTFNNNTFQKYLDEVTLSGSSSLTVSDMLDNTALGEKILPNSTIFVKYRFGGGENSNIGSGILQEVSDINAAISGTDPQINQSVIQSTRANNPIAAMGGSSSPTMEEILHYIPYNFSSQKRCVQVEDYISRAYQMPGKFGGPFRIYGTTEDNKIKLYVLSKDSTGKLNMTSTQIVKNNLISYLSRYKSINDFVEINDGFFANLQIEVDLYINKASFNPSEIKINAINLISNYFDINKWQMNQNIYISEISDMIKEIPGVINVVDIRIYNMVGGDYSNTKIDQANLETTYISKTGGSKIKIGYINNAIYGTPLSMFEVRYKEKDILVRTA